MSDANELQHLIEDCWSVGITFPEVLDEDDYAVLFALAKLLMLHRKRITDKPHQLGLENPMELR